jgi:hypothetical protein
MSAEFFADIIVSGKIFSLGVGDGIPAFDARLRFDRFEEGHGGNGSRMLRRDYGLFEARFVGPHSWRCSNLIVEVHRLASIAALAEELRRLEDLSLPQYVAWVDVQEAVHQAGKSSLLRGLERAGASARYGVIETGAVVDVNDDGSARTDRPGSGDIWSISLTGASDAVR